MAPVDERATSSGARSTRCGHRLTGRPQPLAGDPPGGVRRCGCRLVVRRLRRRPPGSCRRRPRGDAHRSGSSACRSRCRTRPTWPPWSIDSIRRRPPSRQRQHRERGTATTWSARRPTAPGFVASLDDVGVAGRRRLDRRAWAPAVAARVGRRRTRSRRVRPKDRGGQSIGTNVPNDAAALARGWPSVGTVTTTWRAPTSSSTPRAIGMGVDPSSADAMVISRAIRGSCRTGQAAVDLVYHPLETALAPSRWRQRRGARTVDGLGMLVHQAALQQRIWLADHPGVDPAAVVDTTAMRHCRRTPPSDRGSKFQGCDRDCQASGPIRPEDLGSERGDGRVNGCCGTSRRASRTGRGSSSSSRASRPGLPITVEQIQAEMARRRLGYGRGPRQRFEADELTLIGGVRHGRTLGSPVAIEIKQLRVEALRQVARGDEPRARRDQAAAHPGAPRSRRPRRHAEVRVHRCARRARAGERPRNGCACCGGCACQGAAVDTSGSSVISHVIQMGSGSACPTGHPGRRPNSSTASTRARCGVSTWPPPTT